jgi:ArsR family transcriptional regulator, virulence genes transcriptional regulator
MLDRLTIEPNELELHAGQAAEMLRSMSNKWRLIVLCNLVKGEKSVGQLQEIIGLSQSALSQHLAVLRRKRLVAVRRLAQTIYYRISGREVAAVLTTLYGLYCAPESETCDLDASGI